MLVPALLICTVGIVGIVSLHHLKQASGRILSYNYHTIEETRIMEQNLRLVEKAIMGENSGDADLFDSLVAHFEQSLVRCEQNITEKGEKIILQAIRSRWKQLKTYPWPGNVRELAHALERAVLLTNENTIGKEAFPQRICDILNPASKGSSLNLSLSQIEEQHIRRVLSLNLSVEETSRKLGIDPSTLWRKRKRYGI